MRNGIHFNKLTLVDHTAESAGSKRSELEETDSAVLDDSDDAASYYPYKPQLDREVFAEESAHVQKTFIVFLSLSVACAAATIATGSYAAWLSRHQAARQALTDVNEILKSCQTRMSQLESDLQRLPNRQA